MVERIRARWIALWLSLALAACGGGGGGGTPASPPAVPATYATWTAPPQNLNEVFPGAQPPAPLTLTDVTLRHVAHLSQGGTRVKVKFSNLFGAGPVTFDTVWIAKSTGSPAADAPTLRALTFSGSPTLTLAAGAEAWSDEAELALARGADVHVSYHIAGPTQTATGHVALTQAVLWLSAIAAVGDPRPNVVVAFGDSITDGTGSTPGANRSYPDQLSARLAGEAAPPIAVVNAGIGGNRWLHDVRGPSGASRFARDVLDVPGVTHAIILLGINDLEVARIVPSQPLALDQLISGTQTAVTQAHARGVKVLLGTLLPYKGAALFDTADELVREGYNAWVRSQAVADGIVDFDAALRDPADPLALAPQYASPDHLHPNDAGYAAMAAAVDASRLR